MGAAFIVRLEWLCLFLDFPEDAPADEHDVAAAEDPAPQLNVRRNLRAIVGEFCVLEQIKSLAQNVASPSGGQAQQVAYK